MTTLSTYQGWSNYATAMVAKHFDKQIDIFDNPTADELARMVDYHIEDISGDDLFIYALMQENLERIDYDELEQHYCDDSVWRERQREQADCDQADDYCSERGLYDD